MLKENLEAVESKIQSCVPQLRQKPGRGHADRCQQDEACGDPQGGS